MPRHCLSLKNRGYKRLVASYPEEKKSSATISLTGLISCLFDPLRLPPQPASKFALYDNQTATRLIGTRATLP
ncbi:hypothetical protein N3K66_002491 [Trichothecium roseum]|uniref:Uncharacterized protein n=1 Tax=Trichothecium roseum TaxID=47278 RepID=A0ACC0VA12_9HYPO|nr:hypothetical protein N3K66_002491 [Trichothecium roseum]